MLARDLMEDFPVVEVDSDAEDAARLLVERALPGLVVVDRQGLPLVVLPGSDVLRFAMPDYIEHDPSLARILSERDADRMCRDLAGHTVAQLMPGKDFLPKHDRDRPVVDPSATALQISSVMTQQHSPMVAVVEDGRVLGVITVHRLLGALLPPR